MSMVFSRRSFLKYTAVAAVAVAGSSLLSGCDGVFSNPNRPTGVAGQTLTLEGSHKLENPIYTASTNTLTCDMTLKCTSANGLSVMSSNFSVKVTDKDGKVKADYNTLGTTNNGVSISSGTQNLSKGQSMTTKLTVTGFAFEETDTVAVCYWPRKYATATGDPLQDVYATWVLQNPAKKIADIKTV